MPDQENRSLGRVVRRDAIKTIAAGATFLPILPAAAQHAGHAASSASTTDAYTPQVFKGPQHALLNAICDRIIPRTDTPGAADAGVVNEIDWMATRRGTLAKSVAEALERVEKAAGKPFASLNPEQQDNVLRKMSANLESPDGKAFALLKRLTLDGYYNTQAGLVDELEWHGNTYLPEFKGCTHDHAPMASLEADDASEVLG